MDTPTAPSAFLSTLEPTSERAVYLVEFLRARGFTITLTAVVGDPRYPHWFSTELPRSITAAQLFVAIESDGYDAATAMALEFDMASRRSHEEGEPLLVLWKQSETPLAKGFAGYEKAAARLPAEPAAAMTALAELLRKKGWVERADVDDAAEVAEVETAETPAAPDPTGEPDAVAAEQAVEETAVEQVVEIVVAQQEEGAAAGPPAAEPATEQAVEAVIAQQEGPTVTPEPAPTDAVPSAEPAVPEAPTPVSTEAEAAPPPGPPGAEVPVTPMEDPTDATAPQVAEPPALEPAPPSAPEPTPVGPPGEAPPPSSSDNVQVDDIRPDASEEPRKSGTQE